MSDITRDLITGTSTHGGSVVPETDRKTWVKDRSPMMELKEIEIRRRIYGDSEQLREMERKLRSAFGITD